MKKRSAICRLAVIITAFFVSLHDHTTVFAGEPYTGSANEYYVWGNDDPDDDYHGLVRSIPIHYDFVTNGKKKKTVYESRILPQGTDAIWVGKPKVISCPACREKAESLNLYSVRVFLEDDSGRELVSRSGVKLDADALKSTGIDFESYTPPLRLGVEVEQSPKDWCESCNTHIGDNISIEGVFCHRTTLTVADAPADTTVDPGGQAHFSIRLSKYTMTYTSDPHAYYRWAVKDEDGTFRALNDGPGAYGEIYSGVGTPELTISNVNGQLHDKEFCVTLYGVYGTRVNSDSAKLFVTGFGQAGTGSDPGNDPAAGGDPAPSPDPQNTDNAPIVPQGGSSSSYRPSTSSSAYTPPSSSSKTDPSSNVPSYSSSSSSKSGDDSGDGYKGSISTPVIPGTGQKITADPGQPSTAVGGGNTGKLSNSGNSKGGSSKGGVSKGSTSGGSSAGISSSSQSGTYTSRRPNSSTVMKNGILYVIDDNGEDKGVGTGGGINEERPLEESVENENAYSAADLASPDGLSEKEIQKGFFDTVPGYIVIILSAVLLLLLALFFLFFGVIIFGEVEEHDEVFGLCAIRLMLRRDGNWYINLSTLFDDNAVLKLRIGLLMAVIFDGWDLTGMTKGLYEGSVTGNIHQNMELHRKDVRRSV